MTKNKGVPKGYEHNWTYRGHWKEKKIGKGKWKVEFNATKGRSGGTGGLPVGSKVKWGFKNMQQTATKIGPRRYQTKLTGTKYLKRLKTRRRY